MKQKVSRMQAMAMMLTTINTSTEGTIEMHKSEFSDIEINEILMEKLCYAFYLDCARYGLIYFQKLKEGEDAQMVTFMVDEIAKAKFDGNEEDRSNIIWMMNELYDEVDDAFAGFNKPLPELLKMYEDFAVDGMYSEEVLAGAKKAMDNICHTLGRDIIHWLHKEIKIV